MDLIDESYNNIYEIIQINNIGRNDVVLGISASGTAPYILSALAKAKENGLEPIGEAPRPGAGNTKIAFFHPKDTGGVLLEIVEVQ